MPTKTSKSGREYDVDGKAVTWHPAQFDDEPPAPDIRIPLRIKLGKLLDLGETSVLSTNETMTQLITTIAPHEADRMREMDVNDFRDMFGTWMDEYNQLTGASLGESSASGSSSASTGAHSNTTSEPGFTTD